MYFLLLSICLEMYLVQLLGGAGLSTVFEDFMEISGCTKLAPKINKSMNKERRNCTLLDNSSRKFDLKRCHCLKKHIPMKPNLLSY